MRDERGRLTLPDVLYLLMSVAFLAALYPVFQSLFNANIGYFSTGAAYIWRLILPLALLVLLSMLFYKSVAGVGT